MSILTNKIAVYTAIIGNYDPLIEPAIISPHCDYICFTDDRDLKSNIWKIILIEEEGDPILIARKIKLLPHIYLPEYEISFWIDSNINILGDLSVLVEKYLPNNSLVCCPHSLRSCIYMEAEACIKNKKADPNIIRNQINKYKKENYPKGYGLISSGILLRTHTEDSVIKIMEEWWGEVSKESPRDQLSFNYVIWKYNYKYGEMEETMFNNNSFFNWQEHKKGGIRGIWQYIKKKKESSLLFGVIYILLSKFKSKDSNRLFHGSY